MAKVMISFPDDLLDRVDREAETRGTTRSGFLQEAARKELGWPDPDRVRAAIERGRAALAGSGAWDSVREIRESRDALDNRDRRRQ